MEESESCHKTLKETHIETDKEVESLTMSQNNALASLCEAEQRYSYFELQQKEPLDEEANSALLMKKMNIFAIK